MPVWLRFILISCLAFHIAPSAAHAQSDQDKIEAQKLIAKGSKLLAKGDAYMKREKAEKGLVAYEGALGAYEEAYKAFNSPQIFLLIAIAEQKLKRYLEAMRHYETMLADSSSDKLKDEAIEAAEAGMKEVKKHLVELDITVEQDGAMISVDGEEIGLSPLDGSYWMYPGEHTFTVTLEGYTPREEVLDLEPAEKATRPIRLLALPISVRKKITDNELPPAEGGTATKTPSKVTLYASFGVSGTMLVAAVVTGLTARSRHDTFSDESLAADKREDARSSGKNYTLATDLLVAGGLLAAGYGLFSYYTSYKPEKERLATAQTALWITPFVAPDRAGLAVGASF